HTVETPFSEWFPTWWQRKDLFETPILLANLATFFTLLIFIRNKKWSVVGLQIFILLSGLFWFVHAPDVRFAFGILFVGAGLSVASFFLLPIFQKRINRRWLLGGLCLAILVSVNFHKLHLKEVVTNPAKWVFPSGFSVPKTKEIRTNFTYYYRPTNGAACANHPLPCSVRQLEFGENSQLLLRNGVDFTDGFTVQELED
ncbi:MAG: hypothetical protein AAGJ18_30200, partial [Bacteroidota bacterium]